MTQLLLWTVAEAIDTVIVYVAGSILPKPAHAISCSGALIPATAESWAGVKAGVGVMLTFARGSE